MSLSRLPRRTRLQMTPLIDIIFLLLLFFMLSSTFTKFTEIELFGAASGSDTLPSDMLFLRLAGDSATLNGQPIALEMLQAVLADRGDGASNLLISMTETTTAQQLANALAVAHSAADLSVTVLGSL